MGDARRRKLAGGPKFQPKNAPRILPETRTPQELEEESRHYHTIGAAIDFIYVTSEDALKQQIRRNLRIHSNS
jgi:hypothetical protein